MSLLSVFDRDGVSISEQNLAKEAIDHLESLVIWGYEVDGRRNDFCRADIRKQAHDIEWNLRDEDPDDIFGEEYDTETSDSLEEALAKSIDCINSKLTEKLNPISETLQNPDLLNGNTVSGWTGIKTSVLRYILSEYETHDKEFHTLDLKEIKPNGERATLSLEHIFPKNPDRESYDYDISESVEGEYKNRLGNLAVVDMSKNSSWGNSPYSVKREKLDISGLDMIREIFRSRDWSDKSSNLGE